MSPITRRNLCKELFGERLPIDLDALSYGYKMSWSVQLNFQVLLGLTPHMLKHSCEMNACRAFFFFGSGDMRNFRMPSVLQQSHYLQAVIGLGESFHSKQEWSKAKLR